MINPSDFFYRTTDIRPIGLEAHRIGDVGNHPSGLEKYIYASNQPARTMEQQLNRDGINPFRSYKEVNLPYPKNGSNHQQREYIQRVLSPNTNRTVADPSVKIPKFMSGQSSNFYNRDVQRALRTGVVLKAEEEQMKYTPKLYPVY